MARRSRGGRARRVGVTAAAGLSTLVALVFFVEACAHVPPRRVDDACEIFAERPSWREATHAAAERWGVHPATTLAFVHQESRFRSTARPGWRRFLGVIPVGARSSAYGYGQVKDGTWGDFKERADRPMARRDRFEDVADFIGWYAGVIHRSAGVDRQDSFHLYLAYHEGPAGFGRRSFDAKPWLLGVARKVDERARGYAMQLEQCGGPPAFPPRAAN